VIRPPDRTRDTVAETAIYERILLTGGSGFVGAFVCDSLLRAYPKAKRYALIRKGEAFSFPGWVRQEGDLLDPAGLDKIIAQVNPDLVVHLAGQASMGQALSAAEMTWRINFHGSFNLACALARSAPHATMLFSSSATVYGATLREGPAHETSPLRPLDAYSRSKAAAEGALADILPTTSRLIIARPVNHSGPGQSAERFVLSSFAAQIAAIESGRQEPRLLVGDLSKARDFLDVRDVVDAYVRLAQSASDLPDRVSVFNVGSGEPRTIRSLLDRLRQLAQCRFAEVVDETLLRPSQSDLLSIASDASRLTEATGWRQRYSIDDMLQSMMDYWRNAEKVLGNEALSQ
jgi:GDP-4-dehydro-6-deoxy-D-mannose reductase